MYEFIDKNGNISANTANVIVIDKFGLVKQVGTGGGGSPTGPAGGDLSGTYPNPSVIWNNGTPTYDLIYYPLSSNPANYLIQDPILEYANLAAFPAVGTVSTIYVALDTGLVYTWYSGTYHLSSTPNVGISGFGTLNTIPMFTPNGVTLGNSPLSYNSLGYGGGVITSTKNVAITGTVQQPLRLNRTGYSSIWFDLGNPSISQPAAIQMLSSYRGEVLSQTKLVLGLCSSGGALTYEGLSVEAGGLLNIIQTPTTGTISDFLLLRDTSGNVKQIAYPTIPTVPTKTSDLINDGDNGTTHFISLQDLPSNLTLYATNVASGISTYTKAVSSITDPDYNTVAVNIPTGTLTSTTVPTACGGIISPANIIVGNPGIFTMSTIGNIRRTSGTAEGVFYYEVYKRDSGGTETLITVSANTFPVSSAIYVEFNSAALFNNGVFTATDRIVLKFYGLRLSGGSDPSFEFQFGGLIPVRTTLPIPLVVVPENGVTSVAALTLGTTGTDLSSTVANGTTTPVITLNVPTASASNRGALSPTDWSKFNNATLGSFGASFDGMGSVVLINSRTYFRMQKAGTITEWSIVAEGTSPTATFDVWKIASGTALPTVANTIFGTKPALATGNAITSTTLTGWTTTFAANDMFAVNVDACSAATKLQLLIKVIYS